jgi:hypothetical protein
MEMNLKTFFNKQFIQVESVSTCYPDSVPVIYANKHSYVCLEDYFNYKVFVNSGLVNRIQEVIFLPNTNSSFIIKLVPEVSSVHIHNLLELQIPNPEYHITIGHTDPMEFCMYLEIDMCCNVNILN